MAARRGLSAEMSSILLALAAAVISFVFFKYFPEYAPDQNQNSIRGLPGWLALGYITIQLWMLLDAHCASGRPASSTPWWRSRR